MDDHPNIELLKQVNPQDPASASAVLAADFVWHYVNPNLPEMEGAYHGAAGFQAFFEKIGAKTGGSFRVDPVMAVACGDELVVTHSRNSMSFEGRAITIDAVVVWRIVNGRIAEGWDIPSVHAESGLDQGATR